MSSSLGESRERVVVFVRGVVTYMTMGLVRGWLSSAASFSNTLITEQKFSGS